MNSTTLYESKTKDIWIKISVSMNEEGKLTIHGHDSGKTVQKLKESYDYEYFTSIEPKQVERLKTKLNIQNTEDLMHWFKTNFSHDKALSQINAKMDELEISYKFSTW